MTIKITCLSDLHLEFDWMDVPNSGADVLILAGDIYTKSRVSFAIEASKIYENVIYVLGNHEFYRGDVYRTEEKIKKKLSEYKNVHVLQNENVNINGYTFHGCTLWTDLNKGNPITESVVQSYMNDMNVIRINYYTQKFFVNKWLFEHNRSLIYLNNNVKIGDIVITHHAPHELSVDPKFKHQIHANFGYYSDLTELIETRKPGLWFHGHVHNSLDYVLDNTRIICNPRGYSGIEFDTGFEPNKVV